MLIECRELRLLHDHQTKSAANRQRDGKNPSETWESRKWKNNMEKQVPNLYISAIFHYCSTNMALTFDHHWIATEKITEHDKQLHDTLVFALEKSSDKRTKREQCTKWACTQTISKFIRQTESAPECDLTSWNLSIVWLILHIQMWSFFSANE